MRRHDLNAKMRAQTGRGRARRCRSIAMLLAVLVALPGLVEAEPAGTATGTPPAAKVLPTPAAPDATADVLARERADCMSLAERAPDEGFQSALAWERRGGGDVARECQAQALLFRGDYAGAAPRFEALAKTGGTDPASTARLYGRAGWAWLNAGQGERADQMFTAALARVPDDPDLHIDRAIARANVERYWDAIDDLNRAIAVAPRRAEAFTLRAAAYDKLGSDTLAGQDATRALALRPNDPQTLLLRGKARVATGNRSGARADWRAVVTLDPKGALGRAAAANLRQLEEAEAAAPPAAPTDEPSPPAPSPAPASTTSPPP